MKSHLYRVGQRFAFKVATCPEAGPDTQACKSQNAEKCQKHGLKIVSIWVSSVSPLSGGLLQSHFMSCHLQNKSSVRRRQTSSSVWRKEYAAAHKMRERERESVSLELTPWRGNHISKWEESHSRKKSRMTQGFAKRVTSWMNKMENPYTVYNGPGLRLL